MQEQVPAVMADPLDMDYSSISSRHSEVTDSSRSRTLYALCEGQKEVWKILYDR